MKTEKGVYLKTLSFVDGFVAMNFSIQLFQKKRDWKTGHGKENPLVHILVVSLHYQEYQQRQNL